MLRRTNRNIEGDCAKKDNLFLYIKSGECHNADEDVRVRAMCRQGGREVTSLTFKPNFKFESRNRLVKVVRADRHDSVGKVCGNERHSAVTFNSSFEGSSRSWFV